MTLNELRENNNRANQLDALDIFHQSIVNMRGNDRLISGTLFKNACNKLSDHSINADANMFDRVIDAVVALKKEVAEKLVKSGIDL